MPIDESTNCVSIYIVNNEIWCIVFFSWFQMGSQQRNKSLSVERQPDIKDCDICCLLIKFQESASLQLYVP